VRIVYRLIVVKFIAIYDENHFFLTSNIIGQQKVKILEFFNKSKEISKQLPRNRQRNNQELSLIKYKLENGQNYNEKHKIFENKQKMKI